ncbi:MAG: SIS domain-containing protein [Myxococcota bacterium]
MVRSTAPAVTRCVSLPSSSDKTSICAEARAVIDAEVLAVTALSQQLGEAFERAVDGILRCKGRLVVTGMGKSGLVGQKISATLASTGTPSLFLHAAEAVHGDMGRITGADIVLALSNSGESEEIVRLIRPVRASGAALYAMTGDPHSNLASCGRSVVYW